MAKRSRSTIPILTQFLLAVSASLLLTIPAPAQFALGGPVPSLPAAPLATATGVVDLPVLVHLVMPGPMMQMTTPTTNTGNSPQVVYGGGFVTKVIVPNTGSDTANARLVVTQSDGNPAMVDFIGTGTATEPGGRLEATGSVFDFIVLPGGTQFITIAPINSGDPTRVGWAALLSEGGKTDGVTIFEQTIDNMLAGSVGILFTQPVTAATIPIDNSEAEERITGVAIANPSAGSTNPSQNVAIQLVILDEAGNVQHNVLPSEFILAPGEQRAIFFNQIIAALLTFRGSAAMVAIGDEVPFIITALIQNGFTTPIFTAVPVSEGVVPGLPSP